VETLAQTGKWFRSQFPLTPCTAVTATRDWKNEGRQSVWYNSRFYRMNILKEAGGLRIRDIHMFDQSYPDPYLETPLMSSCCRYDTLPVVDGFHWSRAGDLAGIRLVEVNGANERIVETGPLSVSESGSSELLVSCPVIPQGTLEIHCMEGTAVFRLIGMLKPGRFVFCLKWSRDSNVPFDRIEPRILACSHQGFRYQVKCLQGHFESSNQPLIKPDSSPCGQAIFIVPDSESAILDFINTGNEAVQRPGSNV
jgi:hypothetical protein